MKRTEEDITPLEARQRDIVAEGKKEKNMISIAKSELEDCQRNIIHQEAEIRNLSDKIKIELSKLQGDQQHDKELKQAKISDLTEKLAKFELDHQMLKAKVENYESQILEVEAQVNRQQYGCDSKRKELSNLKNQLNAFRNQKSDNLGAYGGRKEVGNDVNPVRKLLNDIDEYAKIGKWNGTKPIGPFGLHVKLKGDQIYSGIIESVLQNSLNAFAVETMQDQSLLKDLLKKYDLKFTIYKFAHSRLNYATGTPDERLTTILKCLEIDNEVVLNQLIINNNIERTVLVPLV